MIDSKTTRRALLGLLPCVAIAAAACTSSPHENLSTADSAIAPGLGTTQSFAVLAGSTITNIGPTVVTADLGVSPGTSITGFPPGLVSGGTIHAADAVALQAQNDVTTAYNALAGQSCGTDLTNKDLGGLTLTPGTYCFLSSSQLTGALTLDAQGNEAAVFVFQIASTLTTASGASVRMINGGNGCNVYWQVGSSATIGTGTTFTGSILAMSSITLTTGASVVGRALARIGAVTMDTSAVSAATCQVAGGGGVDASADANGGGHDAALAADASAAADAAVEDASTAVDASDAATDVGDAGATETDASATDSGTTCVCWSGGFCCGWM